MIEIFLGHTKRSWIAKTILKKNKTVSIMLHDFRLYYRVTLIKIVWYWHKNGHMDQCNQLTQGKPYGKLNMTKKLRIYNG